MSLSQDDDLFTSEVDLTQIPQLDQLKYLSHNYIESLAINIIATLYYLRHVNETQYYNIATKIFDGGPDIEQELICNMQVYR